MNELIALEKSLLQTDDLKQLESLIAEFNVFETLDAVRAEIKRSPPLLSRNVSNVSSAIEDIALGLMLMPYCF